MGTFKWQIYDVVDIDAQAEVSGDVQLTEVRVEPDGQRWAVRMPDQTLVLVPTPGGTVNLGKVLPSGETDGPAGSDSNRVRNFIRVSLVLLFGFGFVAAIVHDLKSGGSLSFDRYMSIIAAFMGGLGAASFGK